MKEFEVGGNNPVMPQADLQAGQDSAYAIALAEWNKYTTAQQEQI